MGCNGSKSVAAVLAEAEATAPPPDVDNSTTRPVTPQPQQPIPPSMAFDIPFDDKADSESIVKKHPPKRLQRLEELQQQQTSVSLEELEEKQQEAEQRRQQFLQLRAQSAKRKYAMRTQQESGEQEEDAKEPEAKEPEAESQPERKETPVP